MRQAFIDALTGLAKKNKDIFLLTGDLGFSVFEGFRDKFPGRFFDVGVAEQNMIGIAAGLALSGKVVFVYSIIPFATMRCFEHIRNDLCAQNLNVKIIGMGAGLHYGTAGTTHHALEDISIMRSLPNMTVISPSDPGETKNAVESAAGHEGPVYIRLSRCCGPIGAVRGQDFCIGKGVLIEEGSDAVIIATGSILYNAKGAVEILRRKGIHARLINIHTIKPIDKDIILKAAKETGALFTVEEHSVIGGLGSAVAEILAESGCKARLKRLALPDEFIKEVGSGKYLREKNNLTEDGIVRAVLEK